MHEWVLECHHSNLLLILIAGPTYFAHISKILDHARQETCRSGPSCVILLLEWCEPI